MICPLCDGNNRGKQRMADCELCSNTGTLGLLGDALVLIFGEKESVGESE